MLAAIRQITREFRELQDWADGLVIGLEFTEPYTSAQNGPAERWDRLMLGYHMGFIVSIWIAQGFLEICCHDREISKGSHHFIVRYGKGTYKTWFGRKQDSTNLRT